MRAIRDRFRGAVKRGWPIRHFNSTGGFTMSTITPPPADTCSPGPVTGAASPAMHESHLHGLERIHQGKVRDIYAIPGAPRHMLIVTTDRLSAFDCVLPNPI